MKKCITLTFALFLCLITFAQQEEKVKLKISEKEESYELSVEGKWIESKYKPIIDSIYNFYNVYEMNVVSKVLVEYLDSVDTSELPAVDYVAFFYNLNLRGKISNLTLSIKKKPDYTITNVKDDLVKYQKIYDDFSSLTFPEPIYKKGVYPEEIIDQLGCNLEFAIIKRIIEEHRKSQQIAP
ncbi:MAG: hypothetical protein ACK5IJ_04100 [Mangrovibacterium sp.]